MKSGLWVNKLFRNFFLDVTLYIRFIVVRQTLGNPINDFIKNAKFFHGIIRFNVSDFF